MRTFYLPCGKCTITLKTYNYSWGYCWMGPYSLGPLNLLIGEPYVKIFWVRFRIIFTEIIEGYLMPNKSQNLVHLRWLMKLIDFRVASKLSWGSAVLATLVPLVNYATVEMHQMDGVLQQFEFRQSIPVALEVLDDEYKIDLRQPDTISQSSTRNILKCGKINTIIYQLTNRLSFQS
ncbi:hypothetical protein CXB51_035500 [Gossypium anomalum]|uniref:Aminotransferase-like plant mobile domain-containing protein n=1 Tax=Gossypium anomalum TaxID=47600 RepID=A0A8J5Y2K9_9ROSI|nr:hypothetical protein CXB51_035500 [Gossypium anomalum]